MKWKKYLLVLISAIFLILTKEIIYACGGSFYYYEHNTQFFGTVTTKEPAYFPFYFTSSHRYYNIIRNHDISTRDSVNQLNKKIILKEWKNYVGNHIQTNDIEKLLYEGQVDTFTKLKSTTQKQHENPFSNYLQEKSHQSVLNYLIFAKKCEINALQNANLWPSKKQEPVSSNETLKKLGIQRIKKIQDPFLYMKYAFQILRIAFYEKDYQAVLSLYPKLIGDRHNQSVAFTRILGIKAGAYYHLDQKAKAAYLYTKMFDNGDAYKYDAMISFDWAWNYHNSHNFPQIYALCQTNHERAVVLVMKSLRTYDLDLKDIKKAYQQDPEVDGIPVLINREINKLERFYFSKKIQAQNKMTYPSYNFRSHYYDYRIQKNMDSLNHLYLPYVDSLNRFIDLLAQENQTETPALWHLAKAYLACMQSKPSQMKYELTKAQAAGMNTKETILYQTIHLLYTLYQSPTITPQIEQELLPQLQQLNQLAITNNRANYQFRDIMEQLIAGKYYHQGDTIKAIYAMAHANVSWRHNKTRDAFRSSDYFEDIQGEILNAMTVPQLKTVIAFKESAHLTPFEQWLVDDTYYTTGVLNELLGTKYIRRGEFHKAVQVLRQAGVPQEEFPDPFMPHVGDQHQLTPKDTLRTYSKLSFSKRMAELQKIIQKNPNDAGALYGYAIALYNISYYGKSADITDYFRHSTDQRAYFHRASDKKLPEYLKEYYRVHKAEKYFLKTAEAATHPELKAKALWGAAKCWEKRAPTKFGIYDYHFYGETDSVYYHHALRNPYFKKLKTQYLHTPFMNKVSNSCDYFSDYVNQDIIARR